ncbi:MAG: cyclic nucleotide-binding domain-containing protein [Acidobacteriia bacterium]|nr:cyclic nucleotide-binding domain-containing protein [Terriglobia bacterium]
MLIREGQPIEWLYILLDGRLVVSLGSGQQVAVLDSGEIVGEISFVDSRPPNASVTASNDVHRARDFARKTRREDSARSVVRAAVLQGDRVFPGGSPAHHDGTARLRRDESGRVG